MDPKKLRGALAATAVLLLGGCSRNSPEPVRPDLVARATSTTAEARDIVETDDPAATTFLRRAEMHLRMAEGMMEHGENSRAELLLLRATADADVALSLARETAIRRDADAARRRADEMLSAMGPR
jgi:hypothetical protein